MGTMANAQEEFPYPQEMPSLTTKAGFPSDPQPSEAGLVSYEVTLSQQLVGPPLRVGQVWYLPTEEGRNFEKATLSLHCNGVRVDPKSDDVAFSIAWSPFSLIQSCRMHTVEADAKLPGTRIFKVSVFHHGATQFFATHGPEAASERAYWVADIARTLRVLTQSLFPHFTMRTDPLPGASWTDTRLLAGYLVLCDDQGVTLLYCELHSHCDGATVFAAYEDELCSAQVVRIGINIQTAVSERVGVDCSCFSVDGYHFTTRTCSEKALWLRAISNVKVKIRHCAPNPTPEDLVHFRASITEQTQNVWAADCGFTRSALLPKREVRRRPSVLPQHMSKPSDDLQGAASKVHPCMGLPKGSPSPAATCAESQDTLPSSGGTDKNRPVFAMLGPVLRMTLKPTAPGATFLGCDEVEGVPCANGFDALDAPPPHVVDSAPVPMPTDGNTEEIKNQKEPGMVAGVVNQSAEPKLGTREQKMPKRRQSAGEKKDAGKGKSPPPSSAPTSPPTSASTSAFMSAAIARAGTAEPGTMRS